MMSAHDYHETLPGYDPDRLLQDGCAECERRGKDPLEALVHLDNARLALAWARAADWQRERLDPRHPVGVAEVPMLRTLWTVQLIFERAGVAPLGQLPGPKLSVDDMLRVATLERNLTKEDGDLAKRLTVLESEVIGLACQGALGVWWPS